MPHDYSEDQLIQRSTADFMEKELGWKSIYAFDQETLGKDGTLCRATYNEVLLTRHFCKALKALNPWLTDKQLQEAVERMTERMSSQTLMQINEQKYQYIRDGVPVTRVKPNGETEEVRAKVIDFNAPDKNEFLCVRELWVHGNLYRRRADIVGFVNGIPLLFMELKNHDVEVVDAFNMNYRDYLDTIPQLFYHNAFIMFSNGLEARVGTIDSKWEFFHEWKRLNEMEEGNIELPTMLRGICKKENFLDLLENFILYDHSGGTTVKILARNHQYLGVNQAVEMYRNRQYLNGKLGVFWHTQGSGKSYSMVFLSQKIRRKFEGSPTIVVLTDRDELNKQISDTFENCGLLGKVKAEKFIASSGEDLKTKLRGNPSFIFSLIQTIAAATTFLKKHGFELQELIEAESFYKLSLLKSAANAVCETLETRKTYCTFATTLLKLWKYLDREDITPEMKQQKDAIEAIYKELQKKRKHADITELSVAINAIVSEHLEVENLTLSDSNSRRFDISGINFDLLRHEFAKSREKNLIMKDIQDLLQERIAQMLAANPLRINFYEKYQEIIHDYNNEQNRVTIEKTFEDLMKLSDELTEEEKRYVREGFENDEQLSMFDVLMKDDLTKEDIKKLKTVAKDLLEKIKEQLATMNRPFDKPETKAAIINTIRVILWKELPESYPDETIDFYRDAVYDFVYQQYGGAA